MVNESYSSTTSMSDGCNPLIANARSPDCTPAVVVRSGIWLIIEWVWWLAAPSTHTGGLARSRAAPRW